MQRGKILEEAKIIVCQEREEKYGGMQDNFEMIANLWTAYMKQKIEPEDVAMMMILLKVARSKGGGCRDNFVDIAGYAACGGEIWEGNLAFGEEEYKSFVIS